MSQTNHLRLLPWSGPEGKLAHLITDGTETFLSRLADTVEAEQIETATVMRDLAISYGVDVVNPSADELRFIIRRLCESVTDLLKIAESRAQRIPAYEGADDDTTTGDGGDGE
ncbi:hypothetical protein [Streptomyces sp. NPDC051286]|uniref:hypothetical protein n=1 Tax=Streptomyces sp. NPDC051286 TaxID=3365647 RepID=UPI0037A9EB6E